MKAFGPYILTMSNFDGGSFNYVNQKTAAIPQRRVHAQCQLRCCRDMPSLWWAHNKLRIWGESLGQLVRSSRIPGGVGWWVASGSGTGRLNDAIVMVLKAHQKLGREHSAMR